MRGKRGGASLSPTAYLRVCITDIRIREIYEKINDIVFSSYMGWWYYSLDFLDDPSP